MVDKDGVGERIAKSLGDYVQVKDRIVKFYELFGGGRLVTLEVTATREPDDVPRVWVKAGAYRTVDDPLPGIGWSWMELPGRTPFTKGSEIENAETSAWGRAIGSLGILIDTSIATQNEIDNKATPDKMEVTTGETLRSLGAIERSGAIAKGSGRHSDLEWRQTPDGYHIGFLLEVGDGKAKPQVSISGSLAVGVFAAMGNAPMLGMAVTVRGELLEVTAPQRRKFYRIVADGIETPEWTLPAEEASTEPLPEETPPAPLGPVDAREEAEIAALPW